MKEEAKEEQSWILVSEDGGERELEADLAFVSTCL